MPSLEERFSLALHNSARAWRQALNRRLKGLGIGQASWMAIAGVARATEPLSQTELADRLGIEDPTMMAMIDRLAKAGYLSRVPSETDRRVKLVVLTPEGAKLYSKVKKEADAFRQEFLAHIAPGKLRAATELLEALQAAADAAT
jgi:MarR family transcriptional regulator for hemolysin